MYIINLGKKIYRSEVNIFNVFNHSVQAKPSEPFTTWNGMLLNDILNVLNLKVKGHVISCHFDLLKVVMNV